MFTHFPIFLYFVKFFQNICGFTSDHSRKRRSAAATRGTVWSTNKTWLNFQFCGPLSPFRPFFRGRKEKHLKNKHYKRLSTPKTCLWSTFWGGKSTLYNKNSLRYLFLSWNILKEHVPEMKAKEFFGHQKDV